MQIAPDKTKLENSFEKIPDWIFWLNSAIIILVGIFVILLTCSVKYPDTVQEKILIQNLQASISEQNNENRIRYDLALLPDSNSFYGIMILDPGLIELIHTGDTVNIKMDIRINTNNIIGVVLSKKLEKEAEELIIVVKLPNNTINKQTANKWGDAEIIINNLTIFQRIIKKINSII